MFISEFLVESYNFVTIIVYSSIIFIFLRQLTKLFMVKNKFYS